MKKLWIVLLSVALIMAFAMPVCAADVKFSGSYIVQGYYDNNRANVKDIGASVTNTWQRLRIQTDFQIQEGLKLTTRFDAMEKIWGASRNSTISSGPGSSYTANSGTPDTESENIKFEHVYLSANLWGGLLRVGYQQQSVFGTSFLDSGDATFGPRVRYDYAIGPWTLIALWDRIEGTGYYAPGGPSANTGNNAYQVDSDATKYVGAFMYNWAKGNAGLLVYYYVINYTAGPNNVPAYSGLTDGTGFKRKFWVFDPYFKAQVGPVYLEGEVGYWTGKWQDPEGGSNAVNQDLSGWSAYLTGTYDFAPMYAGLTFFFVSGNDASTSDKMELGPPGGSDFNPCLMLWNYDLNRWNGNQGNIGYSFALPGIQNALAGQIFVGVKPVPKLDIKASYTIAQADKDGASTGWVSKNYGSELDVTATYKIYDNLSYMVGFAYLWAGDYFKGTDNARQIDNDYLITHKLTLTF
ncbi:MAG: hypothetical protein L7F78_09605 [Syntrophales bacterium LBB04]|nr:hypothetical protein [Syntrophales bacterium LBB04]